MDDDEVVDNDRPCIMSQFLTDAASLWWRAKKSVTVGTWEEFKARFRDYFKPSMREDDVIKELKIFKQLGSMQEYI